MRVAVAGGTGLVGRLVVAQLAAAGHEPVVLARSQGVDLTTGDGLAGRISGCAAVIDVSNVTATRRKASVDLFATATGNLLAAAAGAGIPHLVALSIIGVDRIDFGYYLGKRRQEELIAAGPVGWSILRTSQFHEFPEQLLTRARGPVVPTPRMLVQPVAAAEVAAALVGLATAEPAGFATPMAGPQRLQLVEMMRRLLRMRARRRVVLPIRLPGRAGHAMATGGVLPQGPYQAGRQTYAEHLAGADAGGSPS